MLNEHQLKKTVSVNDLAVDTLAMGGVAGIVDWYSRGRDFSKLIFRRGHNPVVVYLRTLPSSLAHLVFANAIGEEEKWMRAFRACVVRAENVVTETANLPVFEPSRVRELQGRIERLTDLLTDAELDLFRLDVIHEIGRFAFERCFLAATTAGGFRLPPISEQIWEALASQRAELDASTVEHGTNASSAASTPPQASDETSGLPGPATATGEATSPPAT